MLFIAFFSIIIKEWFIHAGNNSKARTITYRWVNDISSRSSSCCVIIKLNCLAGSDGFEGDRRDRIEVFDAAKKVILC